MCGSTRCCNGPITFQFCWRRCGLVGGEGWPSAALAGASYIPHIVMAWKSEPEYTAAQYVEIGMFFVIAALTGILADHERSQRRRAEKTARELAEVNAQLQKSFEQLRRADRLSALGELSAGLAHEIRNPLGSIEALCRFWAVRNCQRKLAGSSPIWLRARLSASRGLLTNFLEFARPQPPRIIASDVGLLLESVAKLTSQTATIAKVAVRVESAGSAASDFCRSGTNQAGPFESRPQRDSGYTQWRANLAARGSGRRLGSRRSPRRWNWNSTGRHGTRPSIHFLQRAAAARDWAFPSHIRSSVSMADTLQPEPILNAE